MPSNGKFELKYYRFQNKEEQVDKTGKVQAVSMVELETISVLKKNKIIPCIPGTIV